MLPQSLYQKVQIMKIGSFKVGNNLLTNIIVLVLSAFTISGLEIDAAITGAELAEAIQSQQWQLIAIAGVSLINPVVHWINQLKQDASLFWQFLRSTNWWTNAVTIILSVIVMYTGLNIDPEISGEIVQLVADQEWINLIILILLNVITPVSHIIAKKPDKDVIKVKGALVRVLPTEVTKRA